MNWLSLATPGLGKGDPRPSDFLTTGKSPASLWPCTAPTKDTMSQVCRPQRWQVLGYIRSLPRLMFASKQPRSCTLAPLPLSPGGRGQRLGQDLPSAHENCCSHLPMVPIQVPRQQQRQQYFILVTQWVESWLFGAHKRRLPWGSVCLPARSREEMELGGMQGGMGLEEM